MLRRERFQGSDSQDLDSVKLRVCVCVCVRVCVCHPCSTRLLVVNYTTGRLHKGKKQGHLALMTYHMQRSCGQSGKRELITLVYLERVAHEDMLWQLGKRGKRLQHVCAGCAVVFRKASSPTQIRNTDAAEHNKQRK